MTRRELFFFECRSHFINNLCRIIEIPLVFNHHTEGIIFLSVSQPLFGNFVRIIETPMVLLHHTSGRQQTGMKVPSAYALKKCTGTLMTTSLPGKKTGSMREGTIPGCRRSYRRRSKKRKRSHNHSCWQSWSKTNLRDVFLESILADAHSPLSHLNLSSRSCRRQITMRDA